MGPTPTLPYSQVRNGTTTDWAASFVLIDQDSITGPIQFAVPN